VQEIPEVRSGEGVIFLDLKSDDYLCRYDLGSGLDEDCPPSDELRPAAAASRPRPASSWRSDSQPPPPVRVVDLIHFGLAFTQSALRYRDRKVGDLILIAQMLRINGRSRRSVSHVAKIFRSLLPLLPARPQCLFEAFFLLHFLARYGHRASWIFGAHLFPFRAHCWIAEGNLLLNEAPHRIEGYQIILKAEPVTS